MPRPVKLGELSPSEWERFNTILDRFEEACRRSAPVDLGDFLPPPGDALRAVCLQELTKSELDVRWKRGETALVEDYLTRFPELRDDPECLPALLAEEYRARQRHGDRPALSAYQARYPDQFAALRGLIEGQAPPLPERKTIPQGPPASSATPFQGLLPVGGGYKLIKRLGAGTFGEVWKAEAPGGVDVAVKIIHRPIDHAEAQKELQALGVIKGLRHAFLLPVQAFWPMQDRLVIAMELADGSLRDELKKAVAGGRAGIPPEELLRYVREASEALDFLHERRVLHRDVKPDNILVLQHHTKLADLGLAGLLEEQRSFMDTICGSPPYMAPEVWGGHATAQSDQYGLAASYVELRLNRLLFPARQSPEMMYGHLQRVPDLAPLAEAEQRVLLKALAKDPARRFATCGAFAEALRDVLAPVPARALAGPEAAPPPDKPAADDRPASPGEYGTMPPPSDTLPPQARLPNSDPTSRPSPSANVVPGSRRRAPLAPAVGLALLLAAFLALAGTVIAVLVLSPPSPPKFSLPDGYEAAEGSRPVPLDDGRSFPSRIVFRLDARAAVPPNQATFVFLVPDPIHGDPFYIMENKVSNRLFRALTEANPGVVQGEEWRKGAQEDEKDLGVEGVYLDFPVFRVDAKNADKFAALMKGVLPTASQWGIAAGRHVKARGEGPFAGDKNALRPGEDIALEGAMPVGSAAKDHSLLRCCDMAGNGYELTCSPPNQEDVRLPLDGPGDVVLCGMTYNGHEPMLFAHLQQPLQRVPCVGLHPLRQFDTSFRVVVEVPPAAPQGAAR